MASARASTTSTIRRGSVEKWGSTSWSCPSPTACSSSSWAPAGSGSTWSTASNTGTPASRAPSTASARPTSRPPPVVTTRSASVRATAWRAEGWKAWGSAPGGMSTSTVARSPTTWATTSPSTGVVTTIVPSSRASPPAPPQAPARATATARPVAARVVGVGCRRTGDLVASVRARTTLEPAGTISETRSQFQPAGAMSHAAAATDLLLAYGTRLALTGASFEIPTGATVALIGPNGSGKSSLLRALAGLLEPRAGSLDVPARRRRGAVAIVLQTTEVDRSLPITVRETVTMARYAVRGPFGRLRAADRAAVADALEALEVADLAGRQLHELSGGQRQRVLVAQGLAQRSELLLLDEPVTGLDIVSRELILGVVE